MESGKTFPYFAVIPNTEANLIDQRLRLGTFNLDDFCNLACFSLPGISVQKALSHSSHAQWSQSSKALWGKWRWNGQDS